VGESPQWTTIVNSAEENRANFCEILDRKPLFSTLYGMYTVTLKKLQAVLKVNTQDRTKWSSEQTPIAINGPG
jgi:hypothetical protein